MKRTTYTITAKDVAFPGATMRREKIGKREVDRTIEYWKKWMGIKRNQITVDPVHIMDVSEEIMADMILQNSDYPYALEVIILSLANDLGIDPTHPLDGLKNLKSRIIQHPDIETANEIVELLKRHAELDEEEQQ